MNKGLVLTIVTVIGTGVTAFLGIKAGKKLAEEKVDLHDLNEVKRAAPIVTPVAISTVVTSISAIASHKVDAKIIAGTSAAAAASVMTVKRLEEEVKQVVGAEKYNQIKENIAKKIEQSAPFAKPDPKKLDTAKGESASETIKNVTHFIFQDAGIKFTSTMLDVANAEMDIEEDFIKNGAITVSDAMEYFDAESEVKPEHKFRGWTSDRVYDFTEHEWIEFDHSFVEIDGVLWCQISTSMTPPEVLEGRELWFYGL